MKDEHGNLQLSKAAKAFHPGPGVYRSSYMNARRLAVTENNMAYRTADYERYQRFDFVVGIEVHLSNNHNCKGVPNGQFVDICDELQGRYPKDFKFVGWHPHCRCYVTSILKTPEEMEADEERMNRGEEPTTESENEVKDVPRGFKKWLDDNEERIANSKSLPYFLRDNGELVNGRYELTLSTPRNLPLDNLTENEAKIASVLGISKGEVMTFERANELRGNPHYIARSGDGYTINCQSAVVANELRRRGWDVEAFANTQEGSNIPYQLSFKTNWAWIDPATGKTPKKTTLTGRMMLDKNKNVTEDFDAAVYTRGGFKEWRLFQQIDRATKEKGRYHLDWTWKGSKNGHIITLERLEDGTLRWYDPQTGEITSWKYYKKRISTSYQHPMHVLRVDNLEVNTSIIGKVVAPAKTTKPIIVDALTVRKQEAYNLWKKVTKNQKTFKQRDESLKALKQAYLKTYKATEDEWQEVIDYILEREMAGVSGSQSKGSFVIDEKKLKQAKKSNGERIKFEKEERMGKNFADKGYDVTLLDDTSLPDGSYDALINGLKAEFKSLSSHNNIQKQASEAIKKKKAQIIAFEFTNNTPQIRRALEELAQKGYKFIYYFTENPNNIIEVL